MTSAGMGTQELHKVFLTDLVGLGPMCVPHSGLGGMELGADITDAVLGDPGEPSLLSSNLGFCHSLCTGSLPGPSCPVDSSLVGFGLELGY